MMDFVLIAASVAACIGFFRIAARVEQRDRMRRARELAKLAPAPRAQREEDDYNATQW